MEDNRLTISVAFGYMSIESTQRYENGRIILGYINTKHDRYGKVVSVKKGDTMSVGYANGSMAEEEAMVYMSHGIGLI